MGTRSGNRERLRGTGGEADERCHPLAREFEAEGFRLAFSHAGLGEPKLLYIHGSYSAATTGAPLVQELAARGQVWAPDLPGHGYSGPFPREASIYEAARALAAFVRGQCQGHVSAVIGHSLGGVVAMALAERYPETCRALILISSPADSRRVPLWAKALKSKLAAGPMSWSMWLMSRLARLLTKGLGDDRAGVWKMVAHGADRASRRATIGLFQSAGRLDPEETARPLSAHPTLILGATQDRIVRPAHALELQRLMPHAELRWLSGGDHLSPYNDSERVARYIFAFLKSVPFEEIPIKL